MKVTVTNYVRMTEMEVERYATEKERRHLQRWGWKWNRDAGAWYNYERGASDAESIFDDAEVEIVNKKSPVTVVKRGERTDLSFYEIPDEDVRSTIKKRGFKWDSDQKVWYSTADNAEETAREILSGDDYKIVVKTETDGRNVALYAVVDALKAFKDAARNVRKALNDLKDVDEKGALYSDAIEKRARFNTMEIEYCDDVVKETIDLIQRNMIK